MNYNRKQSFSSPVCNNNSNSFNRSPFHSAYRATSQSFNSSCSPEQWSTRSNQSYNSDRSSSSYFGDVSQLSPYSSPHRSRGSPYYSQNKNKRFQRKQGFQSPESDSNPGHSYNIKDYVDDSMLEDPWKELMAEIEKKDKEKNDKYIVERHGKTLLPQYIGMYRLTVEGAETYIVVMRNIFSTRLKIHKKYDLKEKDNPVLKDNDFVKDGCKMMMGSEAKEKILEMLNADAMFLSSMNLMDYSVCLGIHDCEQSELDAQEKEKCDHSDGEGSGENGPGSDEDEDSAGSGIGGAGPTPPDSPQALRDDLPLNGEGLNPTRDIYATASAENCMCQ